MYCLDCGHALPPTASFCVNCGRRTPQAEPDIVLGDDPPAAGAAAAAVLQPPAPRVPGWMSLRQAADLWGVMAGNGFLVLSLVITALLVVFEARYNITLLGTLSDPNATGEQVDRLSQAGKLLGSAGISWAFGRALISRVKPALLGLVLFGVLATAMYHVLDQVYTRVIDGLAPEVKVEGFNLFNYRRDLLTGKLSDPDIPLPKQYPVEGKILMGSFPIVLLDDRFMLPARDIVARKAGDKSNAVMQAAAKQWPSYGRRMGELNQSYQEFISGSRQAYQYRAFGGIRKFQQRSGGFDPNPNLTRPQFVEMLRASNHPKGRQLREAEAREVGRRADGSVLRAGDLPYFMDRQAYMAWFESQANQARAAALPTRETVESFQGIRDINSAIFLPPMAIITSLLSALTNMVTLIIMLASLALAAMRLARPALWLRRLAAPLMVAVVAGIVALMPTHVFRAGTPLHELETLMHTEVGFAGRLWSRLSCIQARLL